MAEITATTFLSLDGVMQAPGGPNEDTSGGFPHGGWLVPHADADMGEVMDDIFSRAEAFLLGRGTYDIFAAHWPRVTDTDDPVPVKLNTLPKYVASRTRSRFDWNNSHHMADLAGGAPALKDRHRGELQVHGSHGLLQSLLEHDLVDELRLLIFPVVLGTGKRLFEPGTRERSLSLVSSRMTSTGTIVAIYRRGGHFATGSFELD
jgi:dihydrofolate reductase